MTDLNRSQTIATASWPAIDRAYHVSNRRLCATEADGSEADARQRSARQRRGRFNDPLSRTARFSPSELSFVFFRDSTDYDQVLVLRGVFELMFLSG